MFNTHPFIQMNINILIPISIQLYMNTKYSYGNNIFDDNFKKENNL